MHDRCPAVTVHTPLLGQTLVPMMNHDKASTKPLCLALTQILDSRHSTELQADMQKQCRCSTRTGKTPCHSTHADALCSKASRLTCGGGVCKNGQLPQCKQSHEGCEGVGNAQMAWQPEGALDHRKAHLWQVQALKDVSHCCLAAAQDLLPTWLLMRVWNQCNSAIINGECADRWTVMV